MCWAALVDLYLESCSPLQFLVRTWSIQTKWVTTTNKVWFLRKRKHTYSASENNCQRPSDQQVIGPKNPRPPNYNQIAQDVLIDLEVSVITKAFESAREHLVRTMAVLMQPYMCNRTPFVSSTACWFPPIAIKMAQCAVESASMPRTRENCHIRARESFNFRVLFRIGMLRN